MSRLTRGEWIVLFGCLALLVVLTWQVETSGTLVRLDHRVYRDVGRHADGWTHGISDLGSVPVGGAVLAVVALASAYVLRSWVPLLAAAFDGALAAAVVWALKSATGRVGPGLVANPPGYPGYFPSGHTATSAVCFGASVGIVAIAARRRGGRDAGPPSPWIGTCCGLGVGAVVGTMTILSANHWLCDVAGGLAVSAVVLVLGGALTRRLGLSARRRSLDA